MIVIVGLVMLLGGVILGAVATNRLSLGAGVQATAATPASADVGGSPAPAEWAADGEAIERLKAVQTRVDGLNASVAELHDKFSELDARLEKLHGADPIPPPSTFAAPAPVPSATATKDPSPTFRGAMTPRRMLGNASPPFSAAPDRRATLADAPPADTPAADAALADGRPQRAFDAVNALADASPDNPARIEAAAAETAPAPAPPVPAFEELRTRFNLAVVQPNELGDLAQAFKVRLVEFKDDQVIEHAAGKLWLVGDPAGGEVTLLPGAEVVRGWQKYYTALSGSQARQLLDGCYTLQPGGTLELIALPRATLTTGDRLNVIEKGVLRGV